MKNNNMDEDLQEKSICGEKEIQYSLRIAVLIPCFNEAATIKKVIKNFRATLPNATIYVYDNNSSDKTFEIAKKAGAIVQRESRQGKGYVLRRMFSDIEADIYITIDGDNTYEATAASHMVDILIEGGYDIVNGVRRQVDENAYRPGHKLGNVMLSSMVRIIFGTGYSDMLSGYRVFSRRFVKSFPIMSGGFEIETELSVHGLELEMPSAEIETAYIDRPAGSVSKLRTFSDGFRIFHTIFKLFRQEKPLIFFGMFGLLLVISSIVLAYPIFDEYFKTGLVPRLPTAVLAASTIILAFLSFFCGLILETVTRGRQEAKRMRYLSEKSISSMIRGL